MINLEHHQMGQLKKYLYLVLGENLDFEDFEDLKVLKPYLRNSFNFKLTNIFSKDILFVFVTKYSVKDLKQLENQLFSIYQAINEKYEIVCIFDDLTLHYRKKLIEDNLPFIISGKQAYIPFLGLFFLDTGTNLRLKLGYQEKNKIKESFTYTSGRLFIGFLIGEFKHSSINYLAGKTGISTMGISRALEDLVNRNILDKKREGRRNLYKLEDTPINLWRGFKNQLMPFFKKTIKIPSEIYLDLRDKYDLRETRELLLSEISDISKPKVASYAIYKKNLEKERNQLDIVSEDLTYYNEKIELDLWEIELFPKKPYIFKLFQVYSSMKNLDDGRIEKAIDSLDREIQVYLEEKVQMNGWF